MTLQVRRHMNPYRWFIFFLSLATIPLVGNSPASSPAEAAPLAAPVAQTVDLDEWVDDFVLESRQIIIPGYPHAFNPGIVRWNGRLLLSFRVIPDPKQTFNSLIGLAWLDDDFRVVGQPQILDTQGSSSVPSRAEDARLIVVKKQLYIVYADNRDEKITRGGFRVYLSRLGCEDGVFVLNSPELISLFEGENQAIREKNWTPFDYKGQLLLAYSHMPHRIFYPLIGTGSCATVCSTPSDINWPYGEVRGGTTGTPLDEEHYLSFFHSFSPLASKQSDGRLMDHYFFGAYTFSREYPFTIAQVSPKPIIGKGFYDGNHYKPYWKSLRVVFPCGHIDEGSSIWVTYGKHDHEAWVVRLDKEALLKSLVDVKSEQ